MNKELIALSKLLNPKEDIYSQALYCFTKELNKGITLTWKNKSTESQSLMFPQDFLKLDWYFKKTKVQVMVSSLINSQEFPIRTNTLKMPIFNEDICLVKIKKGKTIFKYEGKLNNFNKKDAQIITIAPGDFVYSEVKLLKASYKTKDFLINFNYQEDIRFWLNKITHLVRINVNAGFLKDVLLSLGEKEVQALSYEEVWNWFNSKKMLNINYEDVNELPFYYDALLEFFKNENQTGITSSIKNKKDIDVVKLKEYIQNYKEKFLLFKKNIEFLNK